MSKSNFKTFLCLVGLLTAFASGASAATYDLKEVTPEIQSAISNRQGRYGELQSLKAQNVVGEDARGYVSALQSSGGAASVVSAENADRRVIYQGIASQNNLGPSGIATIESVFAEVQRDKARAGESVQLPSGEWIKK